MPTYQYACTECGEQTEIVQKFSDAALTECPACRGRLRKVFSPVGIVFKGSGFYRTDSRAGNGVKERNGKDRAADGASTATPAGANGSSGDKGAKAAGGDGASSAAGSAAAGAGTAATGTSAAGSSSSGSGSHPGESAGSSSGSKVA